MITVALLGLGGRGRTYLNNVLKNPDMKVTAICDIDKEKVERYRILAGLGEVGHGSPTLQTTPSAYGDHPSAEGNCGRSSATCFTSDDEFFAAGKLADCLIIATQDRDHYRHAMAALELGYHVLLEKPVSPVESECIEIAETAKKKGLKILVCHVLRYSGYYRKIKEILDSGTIGDIVNIEMTENEGYWHHANSYTRGPWRNEAESASFLLAKCCHDIDILYWLTGSKATAVSSIGGIRYFKRESAPEGSGERCADCAVKKNCAYNVERLFMFGVRLNKVSKFYDFVIKAGNRFSKKLRAKTERHIAGPQGACVYKTDKDVCDHQVTMIQYENGVVATQTVTAFSVKNFRDIRIHGTKGELYGIDNSGILTVSVFGQKPKKIKLKGGGGHQGGDAGVVNDFAGVLLGKIDDSDKNITTIDETLESHRVIFAAERSRKRNGKLWEMGDGRWEM